MRFFCDDHLRRLARWLRAAGLDVAWESACLLPSHDPITQLRFVCERFGLDLRASAFTRCPVCNSALAETSPDEVEVPDRVRECCDRFWRCPGCGRTYWHGDHVRHMRERFRKITDLAER